MLADLHAMDTTMAAEAPGRDAAWADRVPAGSATLVLIASAGHSGSTLLDLLIGNHPMVSSAGEMNRLTLHAPDRVCACGATVTNCSYWSQVRAAVTTLRQRSGLIPWEECHTDVPPQRPMVSMEMKDGLELANGAPPAFLRHRLREAGITVSEDATLSRSGVRDFKWRMVDPVTQRTWVLRRVERRLDIYDETVTWKNPVRVIPQPLEVALALGVQPVLSGVRACSTAASDFIRIGENSWTVADAMAAVSGTPFVIDSSKSPLRLKLLYMLRRDRVRIVHLVRDGRAVAASAMRRRDMSAALAGRIWKRDNQNLAVMLASVPARRKTRVHYEALCEDPVREVTRIGRFLGLEFTPAMLTLGQRPVHNIPGNPMLFNGDRRTITKDERWRRDLSDRDRAAFERVAGRLNRSFGYR
jgi:hypothetical protein